MKRTRLIYTLMILVAAVSCVKDNFDFDRLSDRISYRPSIVIPLAHGSLTLGNLLESRDTVFVFDPDNSIKLVIREDTLLSFTHEDILNIATPAPFSRQFPLGPVSLAPAGSSSSISLRELVEPGRMKDPEASLINGSAGSMGLFPPVNSQDMGSFRADQLAGFEFARFTAGDMIMSVTNNLPVAVSMVINLVNDPDGSQVGVFSFGDIGPGQTASRPAPLSGIMMHNNMSFEVSAFSSPGSGTREVSIDLDNDLLIEITSENLLAEKGRAMVPPAVIGTGSDLINMNFAGDHRIDELNLESGTVRYLVDYSSRGLMLNVEMVNVITSDAPFEFTVVTSGEGGMDEGEEHFSDAAVDLSVFDNGLMINYTLMAGSDSGITDFDFTPGSLDFTLDLSDFTIGYATGFFGVREVITRKQFNIDYDIFDMLAGDFRFTSPSIRFFYENSLGIPFFLNFDLEGRSSDGTGQVMLPGEGYPGIEIGPAGGPSGNTSGEILLGRDASEVIEFVSLPPSGITFESFTIRNPKGDTGTPNFITSGSLLKMDMEIDVPLEMELTDLLLSDTIGIDFSTEDIESLLLDMEAANGFPLGLSVDLSLYDSVRNVVLHTFEDIVLMKAAPVQGNGIVEPGSTSSSVAGIEISGSTVDHLRNAGHIIITARVNTGDHDSRQVPVRFQTTDSFDFRIKLRAILNIKN